MEGSNSEQAAKNLAIKLKLQEVEFVPLISSRRVIGELKRGTIDYAVVAIKNSLGGTVTETFEAIKNEYLELIATEVLHIHHCVFIKESVDTKNIDIIASHIQALKQTEKSRQHLFPNSTAKEVEDTAIAAKWLSEGKLGENEAIICRKNAGEMYSNLKLIYENVEDDSENYTEFRMFKMSDIDYENAEKPSIIERIKLQI